MLSFLFFSLYSPELSLPGALQLADCSQCFVMSLVYFFVCLFFCVRNHDCTIFYYSAIIIALPNIGFNVFFLLSNEELVKTKLVRWHCRNCFNCPVMSWLVLVVLPAARPEVRCWWRREVRLPDRLGRALQEEPNGGDPGDSSPAQTGTSACIKWTSSGQGPILCPFSVQTKVFQSCMADYPRQTAWLSF